MSNQFPELSKGVRVAFGLLALLIVFLWLGSWILGLLKAVLLIAAVAGLVYYLFFRKK